MNKLAQQRFKRNVPGMLGHCWGAIAVLNVMIALMDRRDLSWIRIGDTLALMLTIILALYACDEWMKQHHDRPDQ